MKTLFFILLTAEFIASTTLAQQDNRSILLDPQISNNAVQAIRNFKGEIHSVAKFGELVSALRPLLEVSRGTQIPDELAVEVKTLSDYGTIFMRPEHKIIYHGTSHLVGRTHYENGDPIPDRDRVMERIPDSSFYATGYLECSWLPKERRTSHAEFSVTFEKAGFPRIEDGLVMSSDLILSKFEVGIEFQNRLANEEVLYRSERDVRGIEWDEKFIALYHIATSQDFLTANLKSKIRQSFYYRKLKRRLVTQIDGIPLFPGEQFTAAQLVDPGPKIGTFAKICRELFGDFEESVDD